MTRRSILSILALGSLLAAASLPGTSALAAETPFQGGRVVVESKKSFDDVTKAVTTLVARNGMMVMAEVDQGKMLSMTGFKLQARLFLVGNPTVGKELFSQNRAVGLYVPLRVSVYADGDGRTYIEYDKPSTLLAQFGDEKIGMVGKMLDEKLDGLATMAAQ